MSSYPERITAGEVEPYVGEGADGCWRSARILREEIDTLPTEDWRRFTLEEQAQAWEQRAAALVQDDETSRTPQQGPPTEEGTS